MNCRIEGIISLLKRASHEMSHLAFYSESHYEKSVLRNGINDISESIYALEQMASGVIVND